MKVYELYCPLEKRVRGIYSTKEKAEGEATEGLGFVVSEYELDKSVDEGIEPNHWNYPNKKP